MEESPNSESNEELSTSQSNKKLPE